MSSSSVGGTMAMSSTSDVMGGTASEATNGKHKQQQPPQLSSSTRSLESNEAEDAVAIRRKKKKKKAKRKREGNIDDNNDNNNTSPPVEPEPSSSKKTKNDDPDAPTTATSSSSNAPAHEAAASTATTEPQEPTTTVKPPAKKKKKPPPPTTTSQEETVPSEATAAAAPSAPVLSSPKPKKSKTSPFRIKAGCVVVLRQDPAGNLVHLVSRDDNDDEEDSTEEDALSKQALLPDPSTVQAWVNPQPGRDDGLALIGKRIRCFFSKDLVEKGKRRVLEGEVVRLVDYGKRKPGKVWKVDLLIERKELQQFTFLTRVDQDVDVATLANDKARRNHRNETRIKGGENKVIVKMRLQHPGSTLQTTNSVQWAIQKRVPAKLFQSMITTTATAAAATSSSKSGSSKKAAGEGGDDNANNERGNGAVSPVLSEPLDDLSGHRSGAAATTTKSKNEDGAPSKDDKSAKPAATDEASRKRARASSPTPSSTTAQVRHVGDGNDPPNQQVANWRWLVSVFQEMSNHNSDNTKATQATEISCGGLVGKVVKVDPPPSDGSIKTLALVTLQRLILPEQTSSGRLPHHGKYEVFELTETRRDERFVVPVEQLLVLGLSLQQSSKGKGGSTIEEPDPTAWPADLRVKYTLKSNVYEPKHKEKRQKSSQQLSRPVFPAGTLIRKYFEECVEFETGHVTPAGWYQGEVSEYNADLHLYKVRYSDGDEEEMYHREVVRGVQHFNSNTTEPPTEDETYSASHHGDNMIGDAMCHRCRRTFPKAKLLFCGSRECELMGPEPRCAPVAWCPSCVDTCHKMHTNIIGGSRETLPCCSGMCDCRECWSRFATGWQMHYDSHAKDKNRKRLKDGNESSDGEDNRFFGSAEALADVCDVVDFVMDRSAFLDVNQLAAPAPNPMKRVKAKGKALKQFLRVHERKTGKPGGESETRPDPLADEDFSVFKPTCAREISYEKQREMKRPLTFSVASQSKDVPRNMREVHKQQKKLLTESNPDEKTNISRAARAKQRQFLKGAASLGLSLDVLSGRESQLRFGRSTIHNWGVFADMEIAEGDMIVEYRGEIISNARAEQREKEYEEAKLPDYMFRVDKDTVCDATKLGNVARFINASCDPNCTAKIITVEGEKRIVVYAKKDIGEGDELTYDYKFAFDEDPAKRIPCLCRSPNCRGFLNWDKKYVSEQELEEKAEAGRKERSSGVRAKNES